LGGKLYGGESHPLGGKGSFPGTNAAKERSAKKQKTGRGGKDRDIGKPEGGKFWCSRKKDNRGKKRGGRNTKSFR